MKTCEKFLVNIFRRTIFVWPILLGYFVYFYHDGLGDNFKGVYLFYNLVMIFGLSVFGYFSFRYSFDKKYREKVGKFRKENRRPGSFFSSVHIYQIMICIILILMVLIVLISYPIFIYLF